jgi:uncharacterized protein (TIGR00369 family)
LHAPRTPAPGPSVEGPPAGGTSAADAAAQGTAPTGEQLARAWFEHSPLIGALGMRLRSIAPDAATVELPYVQALATAGDVVHGGAIMSLLDTAAALAAWSAHDPGRGVRWGTVGVSVNFLASAEGRDLRADARVSRRGRSICYCHVEVVDSEQTPVAEGLVSYRLG